MVGRAVMKELIQVIKEALVEHNYDVYPSPSDTEIVVSKDGSTQRFVISVAKK